MNQSDAVIATFRPARTDDLQPGAAWWIGRRGLWEAMWLVDGGPYDGQWAMGPRHFGDVAPFVWVPLCDLVDIVPALPRNAITIPSRIGAHINLMR